MLDEGESHLAYYASVVTLEAAITVGSLAKCAHHLDAGPERRARPFWIAGVKSQSVNEFHAARIISMCGLYADSALIQLLWAKIKALGGRSA